MQYCCLQIELEVKVWELVYSVYFTFKSSSKENTAAIDNSNMDANINISVCMKKPQANN